MNLLIDIGNSRIKYLYENNGILSEVKSLLPEYLDQIFSESSIVKIRKIIFASVGKNELVANLLALAEKANIKIHQVTTERHRNNLYCAYSEFHKFGVDRWLVLVAAINTYPQKNCLIIDAGTATTLDLLSAKGEHLGGWIIAGIELMQQSLVTHTAKIKETNYHSGGLGFARNTADSIKHGALAATVGAINLAIAQAKQQVSSIDHVILTGGNGVFIAKYLSDPIILDEKFIFKGLQQYIKSNPSS